MRPVLRVTAVILALATCPIPFEGRAAVQSRAQVAPQFGQQPAPLVGIRPQSLPSALAVAPASKRIPVISVAVQAKRPFRCSLTLSDAIPLSFQAAGDVLLALPRAGRSPPVPAAAV